MADNTVLPTLAQLTYFQWSIPTAPNPRLAAPITSTATTITFTSAPLDEDGAVITAPFLMGVKNSDSFVETIYCPNGADGASGLSATGCVRGIDLAGLDFTVGDTGNAAAHGQDSPIFCNVTAVIQAIMLSAIQGSVATGGTGLIIGDDTDGVVTISHSTGAGTSLGFLRFESVTDKAQFSNDGVVWNDIDNVTGSNLVVVSADDTTPADLETKLVSATGGIDFTTLNPAGNETLNLAVDLSEAGITAGPLASVISDVSATEAEIDQALDGISANVTDTNLNTLTAGSSSSGDALHSHQNPTISFTTAEAVTADDALALLPIEVEYFAQLTDANLALGDANARRRYAVQFIPSETVTFTTMNFRAAEAVNGATTLGNLDITIETDNAGEPSGTPVANGSADAITQAVQRTWNTTQATRTATWGASPTLTAGTTYWLVFGVNATDAANFLNLSVNSSHDENYITFTRSTFDLDAGTWGNTVTNATPFFWTANVLKDFGMGVVPCDANWGARTWNFVGFARTTQAITTSVDVYYDIVPALSGLTPGLPLWLSTTAGEVTTTPPSGFFVNATEPTAFAYKIGKAISTTEVKIDTGQKMVWGTGTGAANIAFDLVFWFRSTLTLVDGWSDPNGALDDHISAGVFDGTANRSAVLNAGVSVTVDGGSSLGQTGGNSFSGAGSSTTDVGFTYTLTETGNADGYAYRFVAIG
jgi:hypothetical protein